MVKIGGRALRNDQRRGGGIGMNREGQVTDERLRGLVIKFEKASMSISFLFSETDFRH